MRRLLRSIHDADTYIRAREEFRSYFAKTDRFGNELNMHPFRGRAILGVEVRDDAYLPTEFRDSFDHSTYHVLSYGTPIAWWRPALPGDPEFDAVDHLLGTAAGVWVIPQVTYSATTSNHQSIVQSALRTYDYRFVDDDTAEYGYRYERVPIPDAPIVEQPAYEGRMYATTSPRGW